MTVAAFKPLLARVFDKDPNHWYVEPGDVTEGLRLVEDLSGVTLDPACGGGNVVETLIAAGLKALGTDIVCRRPDAAWFMGELDFLTQTPAFRPDNIVMNPPSYREVGTENFIRRALPIAKRKVAAFVNLRFLCGERRAKGLFRDHPPTRIWFITPRCHCPPGDYLLQGGKAEGGKADYAWLVWEHGAQPQGPGWIVRPVK